MILVLSISGFIDYIVMLCLNGSRPALLNLICAIRSDMVRLCMPWYGYPGFPEVFEMGAICSRGLAHSRVNQCATFLALVDVMKGANGWNSMNQSWDLRVRVGGGYNAGIQAAEYILFLRDVYCYLFLAGMIINIMY